MNVAAQNPEKISEKSEQQTKSTSSTPLADPSDPPDPSPETIDITFTETDQSQNPVADPFVVADPYVVAKPKTEKKNDPGLARKGDWVRLTDGSVWVVASCDDCFAWSLRSTVNAKGIFLGDRTCVGLESLAAIVEPPAASTHAHPPTTVTTKPSAPTPVTEQSTLDLNVAEPVTELNEPVEVLRYGKWVEAILLQVPNNNSDLHLRTSYWLVRLTDGSEIRVWHENELRQPV